MGPLSVARSLINVITQLFWFVVTALRDTIFPRPIAPTPARIIFPVSGHQRAKKYAETLVRRGEVISLLSGIKKNIPLPEFSGYTPILTLLVPREKVNALFPEYERLTCLYESLTLSLIILEGEAEKTELQLNSIAFPETRNLQTREMRLHTPEGTKKIHLKQTRSDGGVSYDSDAAPFPLNDEVKYLKLGFDFGKRRAGYCIFAVFVNKLNDPILKAIDEATNLGGFAEALPPSELKDFFNHLDLSTEGE